MYIGNIEVKNPVFLAPMAGVTDWAYRTVCAQLGAGVTVTEMVSSRALVYQDQKSTELAINQIYARKINRSQR